MSFAEIFLRIGGGIGGWVICFAHALVIAVLRRADCDPRQDELWVGTLFLGVLSLGGAVAMGLGLRWRASLKWLAIVTIPLGLYAITGVWPAVETTTLDGGSLCSLAERIPDGVDLAAHPATTLQRIWPIFQLIVLSAIVFQGLRLWRTDGRDAASESDV